MLKSISLQGWQQTMNCNFPFRFSSMYYENTECLLGMYNMFYKLIPKYVTLHSHQLSMVRKPDDMNYRTLPPLVQGCNSSPVRLHNPLRYVSGWRRRRKKRRRRKRILWWKHNGRNSLRKTKNIKYIYALTF